MKACQMDLRGTILCFVLILIIVGEIKGQQKLACNFLRKADHIRLFLNEENELLAKEALGAYVGYRKISDNTITIHDQRHNVNGGTAMVETYEEEDMIAAGENVTVTATKVKRKSDIKLRKNTFVLDVPDPNTGSEGDAKYTDVSLIGIDGSGDLFAMDNPGWIAYGKIAVPVVLDKSFSFLINAKKLNSSGIVDAGIDRSADGQLGIRGGNDNGINKKEGYIFGLDLSRLDPTVSFELTKIGITFLDPSESCVLVNRLNPSKMLSYAGNDKDLLTTVKITSKIEHEFLDISSLGIKVKGGKVQKEMLSLFNTSDEGSFRISGFEFKVVED